MPSDPRRRSCSAPFRCRLFRAQSLRQSRVVVTVGCRLAGALLALRSTSAARASANVLSAFHRLHSRCIRWQLSRLVGDPPRETGTSSSTSPRSGWGTHPGQSVRRHLGPCLPGMVVRVRSIHVPHRAQWVSRARTRARSSRRRCPFLDRRFGLDISTPDVRR